MPGPARRDLAPSIGRFSSRRGLGMVCFFLSSSRLSGLRWIWESATRQAPRYLEPRPGWVTASGPWPHRQRRRASGSVFQGVEGRLSRKRSHHSDGGQSWGHDHRQRCRGLNVLGAGKGVHVHDVQPHWKSWRKGVEVTAEERLSRCQRELDCCWQKMKGSAPCRPDAS